MHCKRLFPLFLLPCLVLALRAQSRDQAVEVSVEEMSATPYGVSITLQAKRSQQAINMMIGLTEGQAILRALRHQTAQRPMTHDLLKEILDRNGMTVQRIVIRDLAGSSFLADLIVEKDGETQVYDARPSDAMALGLLYDAKIFVKVEVFDREREHEQQNQDEDLNKEKPEVLTL